MTGAKPSILGGWSVEELWERAQRAVVDNRGPMWRATCLSEQQLALELWDSNGDPLNAYLVGKYPPLDTRNPAILD